MTRIVAAIILTAFSATLAQAQAQSSAGGTAARDAETCLWAGRVFGLNALFCVAPNVALQCVGAGRWAVIQGYSFGENVRPCANAPVLDAK